MNLKSLIEKMDDLIALNEATKETPTGKIHKADPGGYGRKIDTDEEGEEKKAEKPAVKRGRGRPKKGSDSETGEVKKWDTETLQRWVVGSKPKTLPGKASVKHKIKDESLEEATKETPTGKVHKAEPGGYGRKFDIDDDGEEKKASKPAVKRGRGRPKKGADSDTGEVPQYKFSKDLQSFMIGNLPKGGLPGKPGKKHKLKDWMEHVETSMIVESIQTEGRMADVDIVIQDLINGNSDIYDVMNHPRDTEQQYVSKILHNMYERIAGEEGLHPDDDFEEIQSRILDELEREYGHQMNEEDVQEVAAPGQEDWIKSNKERFIKQYGKKKGMSVLYATAWKRSKQDESVEESVTESVESQKQPVMENKLVKLLSRYPYEYKAYQEGWGLDEGLYEALCEHYFEDGQIPHGVWTGALEELRSYVENKYVQDSQELMENPALAALLPAVVRSVGPTIARAATDAAKYAVRNPITTISTVSDINDLLSGDEDEYQDEYEDEDDSLLVMKETSREEIEKKIKTPPSMRKDKTPLSLRDVGTKAKYKVGDKEYNVGDETVAKGTAKLTGKKVEELPESDTKTTEVNMNKSKEVEESGLQAYLGNKKYGKEGMNALRKAGREGASKEKMAKIRAQHDKLDEQGVAEGFMDTVKGMFGGSKPSPGRLTTSPPSEYEFHVPFMNVVDGKPRAGTGPGYSEGAIWDKFNKLARIVEPQGGKMYVYPRPEYNQLGKLIIKVKSNLDAKTIKNELAKNNLFPADFAKAILVDPQKNIDYASRAGQQFEEQDMAKDIQTEGWEKELNDLLNEGLTVTTSTGQPGGSDSVSVSATDHDAHSLMKILQSAGLTSAGLSTGGESPEAAVVSPVSSDEVLTQLGTDKEQSQDSGDNDMSFLKKMLGQREQSGHVDEMEENVGSQPADIKPGMTVDQAKATQSYKTNPNVRAEVDKADSFASSFDKKVPSTSVTPATSVSGPGLKPSASGQPQQGLKIPSSMSTSQQTNEDDVEEGNAYLGARKDAIQQGKDSFTVGGKTHKVTGDTSDEKKMNEDDTENDEFEDEYENDQLNESRCDECGMYESKCSCDHEKLDEWANSSDEDKQFKSDMDYMTRVLSGGLNNIKRDQTVLPSTKVKLESKKMGPNFTDLLKKFRDID